MPVKISFGFCPDERKDMIQCPNGLRRFGFVFVVNFVDEKSGKIMFRYVPKLEDKDLFGGAFDMLMKFEDKREELYKLIQDNKLEGADDEAKRS